MLKLDTMTLAGLCLQASAKYKNRTAFETFRDGAIHDPVSYRQLGIRARQFGSLLGRLGVREGDRVLLLAENRPEWPLAYFGIALAGAVSVPVLTGFSPEQIRHICDHAEVKAICVSRAMTTKIEPPVPSAPVIVIDGIGNADTISVSLNQITKQLPLGNCTDSDAETVRRLPQRKPEDLASIVYTSGTLGNSKGVMLSNANLLSCAMASFAMVTIYPRDRLLSVIPLAHTYECTIGLLVPVIGGAKIAYLDRHPSSSVLLAAVQALRPTAMVTVPLLIEKIYRNNIAPGLKASRLYRCPLTRNLAVAVAGKKLASALGGSIRFFGIGGAPLSAEVESFLRQARFPYAPGYGLTETSPLVAGTAPYRFSCRSAGSPPQNVEVRITAEGEIQVRGTNVMMGYYRDEALTREAFTADGWLRTGDLGCMDKKGRLYIKGRLKALILGPSGENIYPEEIEGLLSASNLVEDALVYPGEKGELVALVHISEAARAAAQAATNAAASAATALDRKLEDLRRWANKKLAAFSRLSRIEVKEEPFEKTPTQKIKRYLYIAE